MANSNVRKGYKGFDKDLKCRGYQYEIGKTHTMEGNIEVCERGFHAIPEEECPMTVFDYYAPCFHGNLGRYCEIEASGEIEKDDGKIAASKLKVVAEIGIVGIVKAHIEWVLSRIKHDNKEGANRDAGMSYRTVATDMDNSSVATNTGNRSAAINTGHYSAATNEGAQSAAINMGDYTVATNKGRRSVATNTGFFSVATNTGIYSVSANTGDNSAATNGGECSAAINTGAQSAAINTGDCSATTNTGNRSAAINTGNRSVAINTGDCSAAEVSGKESIAIVTGIDSKARGTIGCWLVLTERGGWDGMVEPIIGVRAIKVDGKEIKANTWYGLKDGNVVEM